MKNYIFILLGLALFSCKKDDEGNLNLKEATIYDTGSPAVDGCGWMVVVNNIWYKPSHLSSSYHQDSLDVLIDYKNLGVAAGCGFNPNAHTEIAINAIQKR